jgi:hypothetical protein
MRVLLVIALAMTLGGCATAIRGQSEQVQFDSEPPGAEMRSIVFYECGGPCPQGDKSQLGSDEGYARSDIRTPEVPGPACITPCALQVARNQQPVVTFSKAGYEPQTLKLDTRVSTGAVAVAGNALIGGVIGVAVDAGTGAGMDHTPNPLKAILKPLPTPTQETKPARRQK